MHKMIGEVCEQSCIPAISMPDIFFLEGLSDEEWERDERLRDYVAPGRVYYGFRYLPGFMRPPGFSVDSRRSVLLVRDPRDALVSEYFSYGGRHISHVLPDKNPEAFVERARENAALDIEEYVLRAAPDCLRKLVDYRDALDLEAVMVRRYEDIYFDKRKFLGEIFDHFGVTVADSVVARVAEANDIRPREEEIGKHIRKGAPGDHREKLKPETIGRLNELFRNVGREYGYFL